MSETKWTPGPWYVINRGEPTLQVNHVTAWYVDNQPKAEDPVAVVYFAGMQEGAANARLIAAAPDLLSSLRYLVERIETFGEWASQDAVMSKGNATTRNILEAIRSHGVLTDAKAAIAQAEGA